MKKEETMKIDEIKIEGRVYVPKDSVDTLPEYSGDLVIVRSRDAGVFAGRLLECEGSAVSLCCAYRVWRWRGAKTVSGMSKEGIDSAEASGYSRVEGPTGSVDSPHVILGACEVVPATAAAYESISKAGWAE